MTAKLREKYDKLEALRHQINLYFSVYEDEQFNQQPSVGKWSPAQVIYHIAQAEQFSINYVNKKTINPETLKDTGLLSSLRFLVLKFFLHLPVKYKAPPQVASVPENLHGKDLLQQWENVRKELGKLLDDFPVELLEKNIFKHPSVGRITILQMLEFLIDHLKHHLPQIIKS